MNPLKAGLAKKILDSFTSTRTVLVLFGFLICFLVPLTIFNEVKSLLVLPVNVLLVIIGFNLLICTLSKIRTLHFSTLVIHLGSLIVLAGGLISSLAFVATVNIYEGGTVNTVYNWDVEQDVVLGYDLRVVGINIDWYPAAVKVGVFRNGKKAALFESRTERSFVFEKYRVHVLRLDPVAQGVDIAVESLDGKAVGTLSTDGRSNLPLDFPLDFQLVAFQDPQIRRVWVELELRKNGKQVVAGISAVNHPLRWEGMKFFLTQVAADSTGRPYAGIQISKDPGVPYVYGGFAVLCVGLLLALKRWGAGGKR